MQTITTNIIDPATDIFWEQQLAIADNLQAKPVLILVTPFKPDGSDEIQLQKMLGAAGLTPEQYNVIQLTTDQKAAWHRLREALNPKFIFLIGIAPAQLGIASMLLQNMPNNFNDCIWLPTLSIDELEQHPAVKKQLWGSGMKPIFVDKAYGNIEHAKTGST